MKTSRKRKPIWVIKVGSQLIEEGGPQASKRRIAEWMRSVQKLTRSVHIVWVTSGAIAAGSRLQNRRPQTLTEKQALSALGQAAVMDAYNRALAHHGMRAAQILLSPRDLRERDSRLLFVQTITQLLTWGALPILNENDAVATHEIRFGDNDQLSQQVARTLGAERLILLSSVDGVYDLDGKTMDFIATRHLTAARIRSWVNESRKEGLGSGGMRSKLLAARAASRAGIPVRISSQLEGHSGTWIAGEKP